MYFYIFTIHDKRQYIEKVEVVPVPTMPSLPGHFLADGRLWGLDVFALHVDLRPKLLTAS